MAAAAQDVPVSSYVARVLEQAVPVAESVAKPSDGAVTSAMIRRAEKLRTQQGAPFPEDSADLIREGREQRNAHL